MPTSVPASRSRAIARSDLETYKVLGAVVQFIPLPQEAGGRFCLMLGTIPAGGSVPLHSHASYETFVVMSGTFDAYLDEGEAPGWRPLAPGDAFCVAGEARHAFRNLSQTPAVVLVFTTAAHGDFFREVGQPIGGDEMPPGPPAPERIELFLRASGKAGHWLGTPEENARVGLSVPTGG